MSDFGAVLAYAQELEASMPAGTMTKFEEIRPACMGPTTKQREEMAKAAAAPVAATPATPTPPPAAHAASDDKRK